MSILPVKKNELFELRFHSIGGQGAYTIGQMVATLAAKKENINASVFASYGSEKKGAPVSVFIRMLESEKKITNFSAVKNPNVVVVFHEKLLETINVLEGIEDNGVLIINTDLSAEELVKRYNLNINKVVTVDATKYALEAKAKLNTVMYGAIMKSLDFLDKDEGLNEITEKLSYKYPQLVEPNKNAYLIGYEKAKVSTVESLNVEFKSSSNLSLGYENQYEGGVIQGVNTYKVNRSISREGVLPSFNKDECINCTKCDMTCPDDCFVWKEEEGRRGRMEMVLQGIDYNLCKGCLRCVEICPTDALEEKIETRDFAINHTVKKY